MAKIYLAKCSCHGITRIELLFLLPSPTHSPLQTVAIGRFIMGLFWLTNPPEIYTAAIGLYSLWLLIRLANSLYSYVTEGAVQLMTQVAFWALQALKCVVAGSLLFVVIPLLLGHLVDLFLLSPLRVPTDRTPIFYASTVSGVSQSNDFLWATSNLVDGQYDGW